MTKCGYIHSPLALPLSYLTMKLCRRVTPPLKGYLDELNLPGLLLQGFKSDTTGGRSLYRWLTAGKQYHS